MVRISDNRRVLLGADGLPVIRAGYDAVTDNNRRKAASTILRSEDQELLPERRRAMVSTARDLRRNYAIAAWAIRKHLDYVSTFTFHAKTGDPALNRQIEAVIGEWSRRENFDVAGRHPLGRMIRILEAHRVVDGDVFVHKVDGKVQGIEGDRVRTPYTGLPPDIAPERIIHGVHCDEAGRALGYCINKRTSGGGFEFEQLVPAARCYQHAYFERLDQVRGVTPLSSAMNDFRDTYEAKDYALAKMKISQLFGLIFFRKAADEMGNLEEQADAGAETGETADAEKPHYSVNLGAGPFLMDLAPGDDAKCVETGSPATETQAFWLVMVEAALKSLDIPMSFYDESRTNFFGSRAALNHYLASAEIKRADNRALLAWLTEWKLAMAVEDGLLALPKGWVLADLATEWVHAGLPWWNPQQEVNANVQSVAGGLDSPQRICKERGVDVIDILDELKVFYAAAKERGVPISLTTVSPITIGSSGEGDQQGRGK